MHAVAGLGFVLAASALGWENEVPPRTVLHVPMPAPTCVAIPTADADEVATIDTSSDPYHSERPPSIDLGYIGDSPIGREPSPPHRLQEWEKPFRLGGSWGGGWGGGWGRSWRR
jgi:hypothetical protein